jgi:hypothetical protein
VQIAEVRPGLYRWTARHPDWKTDAAPGSPADWPPEVGCVAYATGDAGLVVIDPQIPEPDGGRAFWAAMDGLVGEHGPRVTVLVTIRFHRRSRERFVERYGAERPRIADARIAGVEPWPVPGGDETMLWLPGPRALVPGDRLIGAFGGELSTTTGSAPAAPGLRVCPQSWLDYLPGELTVAQLRERLRPLLDLPVELVLVSHGDPVLSGGHAALAAALRG